MKIQHLLDEIQMPVSNEEYRFLERYKDAVRLTSLDEHDTWLAQNLVRKGIYSISKDSNTLIRNSNEQNS